MPIGIGTSCRAGRRDSPPWPRASARTALRCFPTDLTCPILKCRGRLGAAPSVPGIPRAYEGGSGSPLRVDGSSGICVQHHADELRQRGCAALFHDTRAVDLDRALADTELVGDDLVR